jgi:ubiquinone/menaquinone biosynthesis C-methylase UbiE
MKTDHSNTGKFANLSNAERIQELRPTELLRDIAGVTPGMTCIDLGCGTGVFALPMADLVGPAGAVYAVDTSQDMLDYVRSQRPPSHLRLVRADAIATGLPGGIAGVCLLAFVLHEFRTPVDALIEARRLLKPGGRVIVAEWRMDSDKGPPWEIRIDRRNAEGMLRQAGLEPQEYVDWSRRHYVMAGSRPTATP